MTIQKQKNSPLTFNIWDILLTSSLLLFIALILLLAIKEVGGTNSYIALAESFLNRRLDVDSCYDVDCAIGPDGRHWVIFPPVPALTVLPFTAVFGTGFAGFHILAVALASLTAWLWFRIFTKLNLPANTSFWLCTALFLGTPLAYILVRAEMVWFYAQLVAFTFVTTALHEALHRQRAMLIGFLIGLAFLSRQMSIFYAPFMLVLLMDRSKPFWHIDRSVLISFVKIAIPVAACILVYFTYNWVRFGDITETGYRFLITDPGLSLENNVIGNRLNTIGLFSTDYALFNVFYMFFQGFHFEFSGDTVLIPSGMDRFGTSILAGSPFILIALLAPARRELLIGWIVIAVIAGITLFYHSNGYSQINGQRYAMDWLPILFLFLALAMTKSRFEVARLLILYACGLNLVAFGVTAALQ